MRALVLAHDPGGANAVGVCAHALRVAGWEVEVRGRGPAEACFERLGLEPLPVSGALPESLDAGAVDVLVTGTSLHDRLEFDALGRARERGVPSLSVLDYWFHYRARFEREEIRLPDLLGAVDETCRDGMQAEGLPAARIRVIGQPYLGWLAERIPPRPPRPGPARSVLFASQPGQNEVENLGHALDALASHEPLERLRVRFHPRETDPAASIELLERSALPWKLDENLDPLESVREHDVVLGISSMLLVEAALAGTPAGCIAHGVEDPLVTHRFGLTVRLEDRAAILAFLRAPPGPGAREAFVAQHQGAAERVVALCRELAGG